MNTQTIETQVWAGCWAAYNEGNLHGEWIEVPDSVEELQELISQMLAKSPVPGAEEWGFFDSCFTAFKIGENDSLESVVAKKLILDELSPDEIEALEYFDEEFEGEIDDISTFIDRFRDSYRGCWESEADFAENWYNDCYGEIPKFLQYHIDWESVWRGEFSYSGYYSGGSYKSVHIFENL